MPNMFVNGLRGTVLCCGLAVQWMLSERILSPAEGLATYSGLLTVYLVLEIWHQKRHAQAPVLAMPPVVTSITVFIIQFAASNVIFWLSDETLATIDFPSVITPSMNQLMMLVLLGAGSMWVGYGSRLGRALARRLRGMRVVRQLMSESTRVNRPALYVCIGLSLLARLLQLQMGVYGYSTQYDRLIALAPYREYISLVSSLGTWALVAMVLEGFAGPRPTLRDRQLLWSLLTYEVVCGFLSGMKSLTILPVVLVGLASYVQRGRFPRWFAPAFVAVFLAAYAVIEPYRGVWNEGQVRGGVRDISSAMIGAATVPSPSEPAASTSLRVLARANLTYVASAGIEYAEGGDLPPGSPDFLGNILWSPARAIVPRLLWDTKPLQEDGLWYTRQVLGKDYVSSTGMSSITYLNFAGGGVAVVCGFLLVGITQRALFDGLRGFGAGGWLVILGLLPTLVRFESSFDFFPIGIIRLLPLLMLVQYFLFLGTGRSAVPCRLLPRSSEFRLAQRRAP
jgi:hypothetical protein